MFLMKQLSCHVADYWLITKDVCSCLYCLEKQPLKQDDIVNWPETTMGISRVPNAAARHCL